MANNLSYPRLLRLSLFAAVMMIFTISASAFIVPAPVGGTSEKKEAVSPLAKMSVEEFLSMSPKKYQELTGEKLSLTQKISLKLAQKKVKKAIRKNEKIDSETMANAIGDGDFSIGGFILGLLLGIIGVLIAYLIGDASVIKWSWIGFGVFLVILLIAVLV